MFKVFFYILLMFLCVQSEASLSNIGKNGLALEGYDPVSYFSTHAIKSGPTKGNPKFQTKIGEITYNFATEENKKEFLNNPSKYTPAFGGWCAYAIAETKEKVEVDPKSFLIQDGRLLLFYNGFLADTRKKWQTNKSKSKEIYLKQADSNWSSVIKNDVK